MEWIRISIDLLSFYVPISDDLARKNIVTKVVKLKLMLIIYYMKIRILTQCSSSLSWWSFIAFEFDGNIFEWCFWKRIRDVYCNI